MIEGRGGGGQRRGGIFYNFLVVISLTFIGSKYYGLASELKSGDNILIAG